MNNLQFQVFCGACGNALELSSPKELSGNFTVLALPCENCQKPEEPIDSDGDMSDYLMVWLLLQSAKLRPDYLPNTRKAINAARNYLNREKHA